MPMMQTVAFGTLLKQLRKRAGMTQRDLAAALGYSDSLISGLEKGQRQPDLALVRTHFIPALGLQDNPALAAHLIESVAIARGEQLPVPSPLPTPAATARMAARPANPARLPALPVEVVGRSALVDQLSHRLLGHGGRLLTLVGPPGVGKTTLALAVATRVQHHYPDGARFIPLATVPDALLLATTLLTTIAPGDAGRKAPDRRLVELLQQQKLLLLLDNLEQIEGASSLIATLLAECPNVTILATSRERLHLRAEQRCKVPPLDLAAAVDLFVQRAQAVDDTFCLTDANRATVVAICTRLDCLPLALELCAAQVELFAPAQLLAQLQRRPLDLLTNGAHDLPPQQRTLRQAIERSYALLSREEQIFFQRLGVFVGGFELSVVTYMGFAEETLQALVTKSLVSVENREQAERRFLYLETIREYAYEQLRATNELASVSGQHANYFLKLSEEVVPHFGRRTEKHWLVRLAREYANLRAALDYWLKASEVEAAQKMASHLYGFWLNTGLITEGRGWLTKVLAASASPTRSRASVLWVAADLAENQADHACSQLLASECFMIYQAHDDSTGCAKALNLLGYIMVNIEQFAQSMIYFDQSLAFARQIENPQLVADALAGLAHVSKIVGRSPEYILPLVQESAAIYRASGQLEGLAYSLDIEARTQIVAGDYGRAVILAQEAVSIFQEMDSHMGLAWTLNHLALAKWHRGDRLAAHADWQKTLHLFQKADVKPGLMEVWYHLGQAERCLCQNLDQAIHCYQQSLALCWEIDRSKFSVRCLAGLSSIAFVQRAYHRAACLMGAVQKLIESLPLFLTLADTEGYASQIDDTCAQLGEMAFAIAWAEGQLMSQEDIKKLILANGAYP